MRRLLAVAIASMLVATAAGCGRGASPRDGGSESASVSTGTISPDNTSSPRPSPAPSPSDNTSVQVWQLRYVLLGHYKDFAYCDPDYYPVARDDEQASADDWWTQANHRSAEVVTILAHRGYGEPLTKDQRLTAYRDHKKLAVIEMTAVAGGYAYQLSTTTSPGGEPDQTVTGVISFDGTIREQARVDRLGGCPICLEAGARIDTPRGAVPVAQIKPGDVVWTVSGGVRVAASVERVIRRATPGPHLMLRLGLSDGRILIVAAAHPGVNGAYLRQLRLGGQYDGSTIASTGWVLSTAPATYDILPAGSTGTYWANGILIGSTLK